MSKEDGAFVLRESLRGEGNYALSLKYGATVHNIAISRDKVTAPASAVVAAAPVAPRVAACALPGAFNPPQPSPSPSP